VTFFLDQDVPDDLAHWLRHREHIVTLQKLLIGAGEQGLTNNINLA